MALSDDAKNELREAIRIVREDRFEQYARTVLKPPANDPPEKDPPEDLPPKKDDPPEDPPKGRKSAYWGELMDDDD